MNKVIDKLETGYVYGVKAKDKLNKAVEPATRKLGPHLDQFANEMDPILNRPIDWILFCYFASHIPITIFFDLQPLYPQWLIPNVLKQINFSYVQITRDPFMDVSGPVMYWFKSFSLCEAILQLPFFFFAAYGVFKDKAWIRLPLAVYGAHVMTTVLPCLAELYFNQKVFGLSDNQRNILLCLYFPYFLIPLVGLVDSFIRIQKKITEASALRQKKSE